MANWPFICLHPQNRWPWRSCTFTFCDHQGHCPRLTTKTKQHMAQKRGLGDRAPSLAFFVFAYCWQLFWYTTLGCVASCQIWGRTIQLASVWSWSLSWFVVHYWSRMPIWPPKWPLLLLVVAIASEEIKCKWRIWASISMQTNTRKGQKLQEYIMQPVVA